jgi:hypothetical protein
MNKFYLNRDSSISFWDIKLLHLHLSINHQEIFGSIVVSISACHSKEQLAGGRGSIPRQRVSIFLHLGRACVSLPASRTTSLGHTHLFVHRRNGLFVVS